MRSHFASIMLGALGIWLQPAGIADAGSPAILVGEEAQRYLSVCKALPSEITAEFSLSEALRDDSEYAQVIAMPTGDVFVLVSGLGNAGVVVLDAASARIKKVDSWSDYLRSLGVSVLALDRVHYRLEREREIWTIEAELHSISDKRLAEHSLWQFRYSLTGPGSLTVSSSLRYKWTERKAAEPGATDNPDGAQ